MDRLEDLCLLQDGGQLLGCRGPCRLSGVLCDGVSVQSSVQGAHLERVPGFFFCVASAAFGVPCGDVQAPACIPSVVSGEEEKAGQLEMKRG